MMGGENDVTSCSNRLQSTFQIDEPTLAAQLLILNGKMCSKSHNANANKFNCNPMQFNESKN